MGRFLMIILAAVFVLTNVAHAAEPVLPVESWIKIGEERQVLNKNFESGLVRRYYVDPDQKNGVGSTLSVFYKDGSEELFWKGWDLYTKNARFALLYRNEFVLEPAVRQTTRNMRTLKDLIDYLTRAVKEPAYYSNNEFNLPSLEICLAADTELNILKTAEGLDVCYTSLFSHNTKPK